MAQNIYPNNYAPQPRRSTVAHLPGQTTGSNPTDGRDYSVEFDDSLMGFEGWTNPRHDGCKTQAYGLGAEFSSSLAIAVKSLFIDIPVVFAPTVVANSSTLPVKH